MVKGITSQHKLVYEETHLNRCCSETNSNWIRPADWLLGSAFPSFVPLRYRPSNRLHSHFIVLIIYRVNMWSEESDFPAAVFYWISKLLDVISVMSSNHLWELPAICSHEIILKSIQSIDPQTPIFIFLWLWFVPVFALSQQFSVESLTSEHY